MSDLSKHIRIAEIGGVRRKYSVPYLWEQANSLPVREMDPNVPEFEYISKVRIDQSWGKNSTASAWTLGEFFQHAERIRDADLSYPIILSPEGYILDGMHRWMKARLGGKKIKVVQFEEWPEPDLE